VFSGSEKREIQFQDGKKSGHAGRSSELNVVRVPVGQLNGNILFGKRLFGRFSKNNGNYLRRKI
jgi:hypothetical protein